MTGATQVSTDDLLTPDEVIEFFDAVEEADRKEVESFVTLRLATLARRAGASPSGFAFRRPGAPSRPLGTL